MKGRGGRREKDGEEWERVEGRGGREGRGREGVWEGRGERREGGGSAGCPQDTSESVHTLSRIGNISLSSAQSGTGNVSFYGSNPILPNAYGHTLIRADNSPKDFPRGQIAMHMTSVVGGPPSSTYQREIPGSPCPPARCDPPH